MAAQAETVHTLIGAPGTSPSMCTAETHKAISPRMVRVIAVDSLLRRPRRSWSESTWANQRVKTTVTALPMRSVVMKIASETAVGMGGVLPRFIGPLVPGIQCAALAIMLFLAGCAANWVGKEHPRRGDEIMVAGRMFHTGVPVVLWTDVGGYDAYRVERRFVPPEEASWDSSAKAGLGSPNRYGVRKTNLSNEEQERAQAGQWTLDSLRKVVDQFVIHYDVAGTSRNCFRVLHDFRCLSVHFMIDVDGTIYQTLDAEERAWHAGEANDRSVGVEIAQIGAYPAEEAAKVLPQWYSSDEHGTRVTLPSRMGDGGIRTAGFIGRPARNEAVRGVLHGREYVQYDFTPEQYRALSHLTAALHSALPGIRLEVPRDDNGKVLTRALSAEELDGFSGILGHCHVTANKVDPGPAMDWEKLLLGAKRAR